MPKKVSKKLPKQSLEQLLATLNFKQDGYVDLNLNDPKNGEYMLAVFHLPLLCSPKFGGRKRGAESFERFSLKKGSSFVQQLRLARRSLGVGGYTIFYDKINYNGSS